MIFITKKGEGLSMLTVQNRSHDPFYNQAFEEYVYQTFPDEDFFFLWQNAPAVVVGSYQNICREVHVEALRRRGIPVVRRMTGGGTVYHDLGNVNYTYILRTNGTMNYDHVLYPVITALNAIGVPARKNRLCDIAIGDQKISGSAQRMTKGRLLHHGTLLFSSDLSVLDHHPPEERLLPEQRDAVCHLHRDQHPSTPGRTHDHRGVSDPTAGTDGA